MWIPEDRKTNRQIPFFSPPPPSPLTSLRAIEWLRIKFLNMLMASKSLEGVGVGEGNRNGNAIVPDISAGKSIHTERTQVCVN